MTVRKYSINGSRFTGISAEGVREALAKCSGPTIDRYLGMMGESLSPSESLQPKIERLVWGWLDGRLPKLGEELGIQATDEDRRKIYGG